ncbi:MAG: RagB/SusD family nutrient uptake outer membrane protein [Paludibacteraceae bacterium]|nr:RagB/SusD family nutrient uptake outer membrane protein [Paludibacteraceae bacterium]
MKTNKILTILGVATLALSVSSCKDFFEPKSPSSIEPDFVYTNLERVEGAVAGMYVPFGENNSYRNRLVCGYQGMNTDVEHNTKNSGLADYAIYAMTTSQGDLSKSDGKDPWGYINTIIERANLVIEGIEQYGDFEGSNAALYNYYLGEALFIRSFAYSEMVKLWGDVPPRFESMSKNPEGMNIAKNDRNIIYAQLRVDLRRAAELLPWSAQCPGKMQNYTGRPSKAAALGLLARIDLTYAGYGMRPDYIQVGGGVPARVQLNTKDEALRKELYEEVLWATGEIIANESFKFKSDYERIFRDLCEDVESYAESEWIWEIPFANGTRGQFLNYNCPKGTDAFKALKNNTSGSTNSVQALVPSFVYDFEAGDKRKDVIVMPAVWTNDNGKGITENEADREIYFPGVAAKDNRLYQKNQNIASFYLGKYRIEWMSRERNGNDDGINYPIIRYTDIMLMYCEAALGGITGTAVDGANLTAAQGYFDQVRSRAGLAPKALNMENLMNERRFEFAGEYVRKYDLQRWGKLKEKLVEAQKQVFELAAHTGNYAQTGDTLYFKYREDNSFLYQGDDRTVEHAFVIDSIWGLNKGEVGPPATFSKENGWVAKNIYSSEEGARLTPDTYKLYNNEENIDNRQFYPIFGNNLGSSNGTLWNDYGY